MGNGEGGLWADGNSGAYFAHDQARSRAYRWGEDGIAGISDDSQHLCFALASMPWTKQYYLYEVDR